jgi:hypothetical protein
METSFSYYDGKTAFFSSDERKWISKIHKMKESNPKEVVILKEPDSNDGCIYCKLPADWLKITPKRKMDLSEEEKEALRERFKKNVLNASSVSG